jgi:hypothetical protein
LRLVTEDVRAGWYPDPRARAELRYWNGSGWTDHVSTGGHQYLDTGEAATTDVVVPVWPVPSAEARRPTPRTPFDVALDLAAVIGLVLLLVFPALAVASVPSPPPLRDATVDLPPIVRSPAGGPLRALPTFVDGGSAQQAVNGQLVTDRAAMGRALTAQSLAVFGTGGDGGLSAIVTDQNSRVNQSVAIDVPSIPYPFQFPTVDAALDRTLGSGALSADKVNAVNDFAGLLVLANANFSDQFPNAASVAYYHYDREPQGDQS